MTSNIALHILAIFALWRLSNLLVNERGLFAIFERIRNALGRVDYDEYSNPVYPNELSHLFSCVWCMSIWVSGIAGLVIEYNGQLSGALSGLWLGLAYAGGVVALDSFLRRR